MTPYLCVVSYSKEDDIKRTYLRINHPGVAPLDIEVSPVQAILLAADLLANFPIKNVDNTYDED